MKIHPQVASVVGQVSDNHWGQVLQTPHAYGVIEVFTADGIARSIGIEILTKLADRVSDPPLSLSALESITDEALSEDVVSLILFVPVGAVVYMVCRGEGQVVLKRGDKLAVLIEKAGALSGEIQIDDTIIAASAGFTHALSRHDIFMVFDHLTTQEVAEKLTILLHEHQGGEGGAAFIYHAQAFVENEEVETGTSQTIIIGPSRTFFIRSAARAILPFLRAITNPRQRALLRKTWHSYKIKMRASSPKRFIAAVVVGLFIISIFFGILHQTTSSINTKTRDSIALAQHAFDEGVALADLNPIKGRERLTTAKELLAPIVAKKSSSSDYQKAKSLYTLVNENLTRAMHVSNVKPELFFDVSLLKAGAQVSEMSLFEDTLGMLDSVGKAVYSLDVTTKRGALVAGGEMFVGMTHIASYTDKLYVLSPKEIISVRLSDQKTTSNTIVAAPDWSRITSVVAYGGNIYVLDLGKNRIWKYVSTEKGFSDMREYFNADYFPDISTATNMSIDGSVWLGSTNGTLYRYTGGKENSIIPKGVEPAFGDNLYVYTTDTSKMVYVLDREKRRVVQLDKDGMYIAQYVWDSTIAPTGFAVSEKVKKIFLLSGGKIYAVLLK